MNTKQAEETITTPDGLTIIPTYVPTIEETVKASGGHRQATLPNIIDPQA
ncbi:hypothetical protein ACQR35_01815 [Pseudarthrobacter sp. J1738]